MSNTPVSPWFLAPHSPRRLDARRAVVVALGGLLALGLVGCSTPPRPAPAVITPAPIQPPPPPPPPPTSDPETAHLATFTTRLAAANVVPPVRSGANGQFDAVLDLRTGLFRWKMSFQKISGPVTAAAFHGPAVAGANAPQRLSFPLPVTSPYEGRATLSREQMEELRAGRWYVLISTAARPRGELRGQIVERF